jgi:hypothetical protein
MQAAFETPMTVAIERIVEEPGAILLVNLGVSRPDNWITPHQTTIKPGEVRQIIAAALSEGWDPDTPSSAFEFEWQLILDRP